MQNDKFYKYIPLIYRILCSISTHASEFIKTLPQTAAIFHSRKQFMKHLQGADIDCGLGMELEVLDYGSRYITAQLTVQGDEHGAGQVLMHELLDQILVVSRERFHVGGLRAETQGNA